MRIDDKTLQAWSAPYRGWHYHPDHVIPAKPGISGFEDVSMTDVPTVYQLPGEDTWYMSFIGFNGKGYQSFVAESDDLVHWRHARLALGFGPDGEFDHGGCVVGAYLYESYEVKAPRVLKKKDGRFWTLYGCYAKQMPEWIEQIGLATSTDLLTWQRHPDNPVLHVRPGGYDEQFCSDGKVFRDGDHWVMFYFGVGRGGAHIMAAFSRDLYHWTADPEPLYKAGGNPSGLDKQYAHKISLVWDPVNEAWYMFYNAVGNKGRGIGLLTSKAV